mmetsp:Transcript_37753/g.103742  ORF Transcript_37753/g.103742 Transcript_37753/m.103742 type:complete len:508 (-) Transcript_37753:101-1624(-)
MRMPVMECEAVPARIGDAEAEAVLPEDAPPGHEAHVMVKYNENKRRSFSAFTFGPSKIRFQVSLSAAGSQHCTEVLGRACYMRFDRGDSVEEVKQFRQECYDRLKKARTGQPLVRQKSGKKIEDPTHGQEPSVKKAKVDQEPSKAVPQPPQASKRLVDGALATEDLKEAPAGHNASNNKSKSKRLKAGDTLNDQLRRDGRLNGSVQIEGREPSAKNSSINGIYAPIASGFGGFLAYEKFNGFGVAPDRYLFFSARKSRWKINDVLFDGKGCFAFARTEDDGQHAPTDRSLLWEVFGGKDQGYAEDPAVRCVAMEENAGKSLHSNALVPREKVGPTPDGKDGDNSDSDDDSSGSSSSSNSDNNAPKKGQENREQPEACLPLGSPPPAAALVVEPPTLPPPTTAIAPSSPPGAAMPSQPPARPLVQVAPLATPPPLELTQLATQPLPLPDPLPGPLPGEPAPPATTALLPPRGRVCAKMLARAGFRCRCHHNYAWDCPRVRYAVSRTRS